MTASVPRACFALAAFALVAVAFARPGAAHAGTYKVLACHDRGAAGSFSNRSWEQGFSHPSEFKDAPFGWENCSGPGAGTVGLSTSSTRIWNGSSWAGWVFFAPAGATISDFSLKRELYYYNPTYRGVANGYRQLYIAGRFGGNVFEGGGVYNADTMNSLRASGHWYGWPPGTAAYDAPRWITKDGSGLAGFSGSSLSIEIGCYSNYCDMGPSGLIYVRVHEALVTVNDTTAPTVSAQPDRGLTTSGPRRGDEPVYFDADDNAGVAKVELREGNTVLASEDYTAVETDSGIKCNFAFSIPCPTATDPFSGVPVPGLFGANEKLDHARLPAGAHQLKLRATDTAGNTADSPPFNVDVTSLPVSNQQPTVTGQALQGATLTANDGLWDGDPPPTIARRWQRCDTSGENCADIPGAVGPQYTLTADDVGLRIRLLVTASNLRGSTARASEATAAVGGADTPSGPASPPPPVGTGNPQGAGDAAPSRSRGQPNGQGAADNARLAVSFVGGAKEANVAYGQSAALEGRLTTAGEQPIAGAALRLGGQPSAPGLPPTEGESVTTDADGSFQYTPPTGPSRLIRASYRAFSEDRTATAEADVRLIVQATGTLTTRPRRVRNGRSVTFAGSTLPAQPGVPVEIQAMGSRRAGWQKVVGLKTARAGKYRFRYRFRRTPKTYTYRFRVVVGPLAQQGLEAGVSPQTSVKVLGR